MDDAPQEQPPRNGASSGRGSLRLSPMEPSIHSFARVLQFPGEQRSSLLATWPIPAERRLKFRYPLDLSVRFRSLAPKGSAFSGEGKAVNLSSGGILVASRHQIVLGTLLEMSMEWPSLIDGRIPLQLVAVGRVLREEKSRGASHFAATIERHEFRTMRISTPPPNAEAALLPTPNS